MTACDPVTLEIIRGTEMEVPLKRTANDSGHCEDARETRDLYLQPPITG